MNLKYKTDVAPEAADLSPMTIGNRIAWKPASAQKGRGVFAITDFSEGEIIETSPVTIVPKVETDLFDKEEETGIVSVLDRYLLAWRVNVTGQEYCIGHGYLMMYNHSNNPNAMITYDYDMKAISMVAARDIKAGEEITFDYEFDDEHPPWFEIVS